MRLEVDCWASQAKPHLGLKRLATEPQTTQVQPATHRYVGACKVDMGRSSPDLDNDQQSNIQSQRRTNSSHQSVS